ncbi:molybdopterin biosynthesis enzyme [Sandaracinobacter sp.]|uniref:molybdopterin biosynthesis enzyme n=1 Tax=Sandaracinobacter sp. TaxID=2487581 RepID=UPI0035B43981
MIFGELPLAEADGAMLAHGVTLGGRRFAKGASVDAALLAAARADGVARLWVARLEPGDVPEAEAAAGIGALLAGPGVVARPPVHGRVNLHAATGGLLTYAPEEVSAANAASEAVGISTLPPLSPVTAGDIVGTVKVMPYAVSADAMAAVRAAAGPIRVAGWRPGLRAVLVQTRLPDTGVKLLAKTAEVTAGRLARLGVGMLAGPEPAHAVAPLAAALRAAGADLLLVAGATATSDARDVIPAAIRAAGGEVLRVGMPVDPGNLLVLGRLGGALVLGLPGCARSPKRNGLDLVLELWAAGLDISAGRIAAMGVGGLLDGGGRAVPWGWGG